MERELALVVDETELAGTTLYVAECIAHGIAREHHIGLFAIHVAQIAAVLLVLESPLAVAYLLGGP